MNLYHIVQSHPVLTMSEGLPVYPRFDVSSYSRYVAIWWTKWVACFKNLMLAVNINDPTKQRALLLHYAGKNRHLCQSLCYVLTKSDELKIIYDLIIISSLFAIRKDGP